MQLLNLKILPIFNPDSGLEIQIDCFLFRKRQQMNICTLLERCKASNVGVLDCCACTVAFPEIHFGSTNQYSMDSFPKIGIPCHLLLPYIFRDSSPYPDCG